MADTVQHLRNVETESYELTLRGEQHRHTWFPSDNEVAAQNRGHDRALADAAADREQDARQEARHKNE